MFKPETDTKEEEELLKTEDLFAFFWKAEQLTLIFSS